eukprot:tig00020848_g14585.t1
MNKLSNVEAQRIMMVLEEAIVKLQMLSVVTPELLSRVDELQDVIEEDMTETLREHRALQGKYEAIYTSTQRNFDDPSAPQPQDSEEATELADSTRLISRLLRNQPATLEKLKLMSGERSMDLVSFINTLTELKSVTYAKLLTSAEEEKQKQDMLADMIAREKKATAEMKQLQKELAYEKRERERAVRARDEQINKLNDERRDIELTKERETRKLESETKARNDAALNAFRDKQKAMSEEIAAMTAKLHADLAEHRDNEDGLRKRKFKAEQEVVEWISKFDSDMTDLQNKIDSLTEQYEHEKKELAFYEEYHEKKLAEEAAREAIRRKLEEEERLKMRVFEFLNLSSSRIQAAWKAHKQHRLYKERKAAGGGGKKGKGKGKSKGKGKGKKK